LIAVSVMVAACLGSVCLMNVFNGGSQSTRERELREWRVQQQQFAAQQAANHQAAMQQAQQAQQSFGQPGAVPSFGITGNYQDPENQRIARAAINAAREEESLIVADAMVVNNGTPTLTVSTLNPRDTRAETKAVSMCMVLMNSRAEFAQITRFVINGAGGVRLADGSRAQGRCYSASTSVWNRM
jgi:hypothetical protein